MKVTFVTPLTRPQNIKAIHKSIMESVTKDTEWYWIIVEDGDELLDAGDCLCTKYISYPSKDKGLSGNPQRNIALDHIDCDSYVYFLDDDNIVHPLLFSRTEKILKNSNKALIFSQSFRNGFPRLIPQSDMIVPCHIDTAQFLIPRDLIGDLRWEDWNYCADGAFFSKLYSEHKDRFLILREPLCYYNYLRK
jgi:hypothetical protein